MDHPRSCLGERAPHPEPHAVVHHGEARAHRGVVGGGGVVIGDDLAVAVKEQDERARVGGWVDAEVNADAGATAIRTSRAPGGGGEVTGRGKKRRELKAGESKIEGMDPGAIMARPARGRRATRPRCGGSSGRAVRAPPSRTGVERLALVGPIAGARR
jgi:hypothetical protein